MQRNGIGVRFSLFFANVRFDGNPIKIELIPGNRKNCDSNFHKFLEYLHIYHAASMEFKSFF